MGYSQSFEGVITYSVEFEMKGKLEELKDQVLEKLEREGAFYDTVKIFIKGDRYKKITNAEKAKSTIYIPEENELYFFEKGSEYVTILTAAEYGAINLNLPEPEVVKLDSVKMINGIHCNLLKLKWGNFGEGYYAYNSEKASIDPVLYREHNFEYLNVVLAATKSYPLEMTSDLNNVIAIRMTLASLQAVELTNEVFQIPALKKAEKKMTKFVDQATKGRIMKIKN